MQDGRRTGAQLGARALHSVGMQVLFTLPGSHIGALLDEVRTAGARVVSVRHEENAVLMAEGWALATAGCGFAMVTAGPGLANALPGIVEANAAGAPVVIVAGRTALGKRGRGAVQDLEQLRVVAGVVKWSAECLAPERTAEYVVEAYRHAVRGAPGVAYLEIPEDVLEAEVGDSLPPTLAPISKSVPDARTLAQASDLLRRAERPLVVAGSGAFFSQSGDALRDFTELTGVPVTTTSAARGLLDDEHPNCLGSLVHGGAALASADLALVVGSRFNGNLIYGRPPLFGEEQVIVQVDLRPENLGGAREPTLGLLGDVGATLAALGADLKSSAERWRGWRAAAATLSAGSREMWAAEAEGDGSAVGAGWVARQVAARFEAEGGGTWISDGGDSVTWGIAFSRAHRPGSNMLIGSSMGTLGVGLPFAIAAGMARPQEPMILFTGDGAFGFAAMELDTAARQRIGMVAVVVNNGVWRGPGSSRRDPAGAVDHAALAVGLGAQGERVTRREELDPALTKAFTAARTGNPFVIDVACDPTVVSQLLRGLDELGLM